VLFEQLEARLVFLSYKFELCLLLEHQLEHVNLEGLRALSLKVELHLLCFVEALLL